KLQPVMAPEWRVSRWFNTSEAPSLASLRGKVVVLHAFQMLCPGCVSHGLPQAQRIHETFGPDDVAVIGLHTVFEHHAVMNPAALEAFIHEYRWSFPIGVDQPEDPAGPPFTMGAYAMRGTPSLILIDRAGVLRKHGFGREDDLKIGAEIAFLAGERAAPRETAVAGNPPSAACAPDGCPV
ncbi:MAG: peroxiredoxin family protein, partial [Dongiaceae bacterium]